MNKMKLMIAVAVMMIVMSCGVAAIMDENSIIESAKRQGFTYEDSTKIFTKGGNTYKYDTSSFQLVSTQYDYLSYSPATQKYSIHNTQGYFESSDGTQFNELVGSTQFTFIKGIIIQDFSQRKAAGNINILGNEVDYYANVIINNEEYFLIKDEDGTPQLYNPKTQVTITDLEKINGHLKSSNFPIFAKSEAKPAENVATKDATPAPIPGEYNTPYEIDFNKIKERFAITLLNKEQTNTGFTLSDDKNEIINDNADDKYILINGKPTSIPGKGSFKIEEKSGTKVYGTINGPVRNKDGKPTGNRRPDRTTLSDGSQLKFDYPEKTSSNPSYITFTARDGSEEILEGSLPLSIQTDRSRISPLIRAAGYVDYGTIDTETLYGIAVLRPGSNEPYTKKFSLNGDDVYAVGDAGYTRPALDSEYDISKIDGYLVADYSLAAGEGSPGNKDPNVDPTAYPRVNDPYRTFRGDARSSYSGTLAINTQTNQFDYAHSGEFTATGYSPDGKISHRLEGINGGIDDKNGDLINRIEGAINTYGENGNLQGQTYFEIGNIDGLTNDKLESQKGNVDLSAAAQTGATVARYDLPVEGGRVVLNQNMGDEQFRMEIDPNTGQRSYFKMVPNADDTSKLDKVPLAPDDPAKPAEWNVDNVEYGNDGKEKEKTKIPINEEKAAELAMKSSPSYSKPGFWTKAAGYADIWFLGNNQFFRWLDKWLANKYEGISAISGLVAQNSPGYRKYQQDVHEAFCTTIIFGGIDCWIQHICDATYFDDMESDSVATTTLASGATVVAAHIEGERSLPSTYVDENGKTVTGWYYKVTYYVMDNPEEGSSHFTIRLIAGNYEGKSYKDTVAVENKAIEAGAVDAASGAAARVFFSENYYDSIQMTLDPPIRRRAGVTGKLYDHEIHAPFISTGSAGATQVPEGLGEGAAGSAAAPAAAENWS